MSTLHCPSRVGNSQSYSSNVYRRPVKFITVLFISVLYLYFSGFALSHHPLQSTTIPHIMGDGCSKQLTPTVNRDEAHRPPSPKGPLGLFPPLRPEDTPTGMASTSSSSLPEPEVGFNASSSVAVAGSSVSAALPWSPWPRLGRKRWPTASWPVREEILLPRSDAPRVSPPSPKQLHVCWNRSRPAGAVGTTPVSGCRA